MDNLYVADVLSIDGTSNKLMISLAYEDGYTINDDNSITGIKKKISSLTSGDLMDNLYVADVLEIDGTSNKLMISLAYEDGYTINSDNSITGTKKTLSSLTSSDFTEDLYLADVLNVTGDSSKLMISLAYEDGYTINDDKSINGTKKKLSSLTNGDLMDSLYVADVLNIDGTSNKLMISLAYEDGYTINNDNSINGTKKKISALTSGDLMDNLYVADVLNIDGTSSKLMISLAYEDGYTINDDNSINGTKKKISALTSGNLMDDLYVADVLNIDGTSSKLMISLAYEDGYTINPDNSIDGTKKKISSLTSGDLMDNLYVADVLNIDGTSSKLMISLAYEDGYTINPDNSIDGTKKKISALSSGNFIDSMELYLALGLDMNDADSISAIMRALAFGKEYKGEGNKSDYDYEIVLNPETAKNEIKMIDGKSPKTISSLNGNFVSDLTLGEIIEITPASPAILIALQDTSISNLSGKINELTLLDILGEEQCQSNQLLGTMATWKINDFGSNVNNLKLGQIIDTSGENTPKLLKALSNTQINELGTAVNDLKLKDIIPMEDSDNVILKQLENSSLTSLSSDISNLTIESLFEEEIYKMNSEKTKYLDKNGNEIDQTEENWESKRVLTGTWKYLLDDDISTEGAIQEHKLTDMTTLITNMTNNLQKATLRQLNEDGILTLNSDILNNELVIGPVRYPIGNLTISGLINLLGLISQAPASN